MQIGNNNSGLFTAETKRNLINNSTEYYNKLQYLNDCLRAGYL